MSIKKITMIIIILTVCISIFTPLVEAVEEGKDYFIYEGSGDDFIEIEKRDEQGILMIQGNHQERHFSIIGYDDNNNRTETFVNTTNIYNGRVPLDFNKKDDTSYLEIKAIGNWRIASVPIVGGINDYIKAPDITSDIGDGLVFVDNNPNMLTIKGNKAQKHFAIKAWYGNMDKRLLVNTTNYYEGTVRLPENEKVYIIEVSAVGDWKIEAK